MKHPKISEGCCGGEWKQPEHIPTVRTGVRVAKTDIKTQEDGLAGRGMNTSLQMLAFKTAVPQAHTDMGSG